VCPINKGKNWTHQQELQPDVETVKPLLLPLLTMTNREFKEKFGRSAASWRGKKPIQRNAILALGNFKDESAVPALAHVLKEDARPDIRATAAWSLGRIGSKEARDALLDAFAMEKDAAVRDEIGKAIHNGGQS